MNTTTYMSRHDLSIVATAYFGVSAAVQTDGEIWLIDDDDDGIGGWTSEQDRDAFYAWLTGSKSKVVIEY
jgi:hypothetical protein